MSRHVIALVLHDADSIIKGTSQLLGQDEVHHGFLDHVIPLA